MRKIFSNFVCFSESPNFKKTSCSWGFEAQQKIVIYIDQPMIDSLLIAKKIVTVNFKNSEQKASQKKNQEPKEILGNMRWNFEDVSMYVSRIIQDTTLE